MRLTNKLPQRNHNLSPASPLGNFLKSLIGGAVILAVLYFGMVWMLDLCIPHISPEMEAWLGNVFSRHYDGGGRTGEEVRLQHLLDSLAATGPALPYRPVVHIEQSDGVNAFALPGGNIVVLSGLLDQAASEREEAFVLAHELGHIAHRDHLLGLGRAITLTSLNLLCSAVAGVELLPETLVLYDRSVSRQREAAADRFGLDRFYRFYGDLDGSFDFFERQKAQREQPAWAEYFSTHPGAEHRIALLQRYAADKAYAAKPVP
ncbi:M48 family metalloprotease [Pseudodesulfovibrio cashew]|uniref:M48 family metalloprotease n=1 Tax=Pseudodesulfovibrio cashew TaxID=2678688 RepID=A0A6I6JRB9_9BACT|nr:M48 family metallopeptidase [Pseudodesulfovibrio cashew]QGY40144.1 M48 family metalloprotease [Pseudodesulfovibrio cashew]